VRLLVSLLLATLAQAQERPLFYGLLHAHTYFSDGSGTPEQAFARAKSKGLDFFGISEHNHKDAEQGATPDRADHILIADITQLYEANGTVQIQRLGRTVTVKSVRLAARDATSPSFVALYGQEFSSISKGNHVNVFQPDRVLTVPNGDFHGLYDHLAGLTPVPVVQMNHPDFHADLFYQGQNPDTKRNMFNDYGLDDYGQDFSALVQETGRFVSLIEVLSGPAMKKARVPDFHYDALENDYYYYLVQGFHISPTAGHDNHYETWGDATDARTGVYADGLTAAQLLDAFRQNRTFATEDKDLKLEFSINGQPMGSVLQLPADTDLVIKVNVADPSDGIANTEVTLVRGQVAPQKSGTLQKLIANDGIADSGIIGPAGSLELRGLVASGDPEFFYIKAVESDGDRAWSAPIWINHPRIGGTASPIPAFSWTRNPQSTVYHRSKCKSVRQIKPENLVQGDQPPAGRTLHNCVLVESEDPH
jgi:hypothetical protein